MAKERDELAEELENTKEELKSAIAEARHA